jgi:dipeptidyl aminopeptidase/acylaminoacyl peptidase
MHTPKLNLLALIALAAASTAFASDKTNWHLIVGRDGTRTAIRMSDGNVSEVKLGGGELAPDPNMHGATRTVSHALSPDGKRIIYQMQRGSKVDNNFIAMANADGKNFRLVGSEGKNVSPAWSTDGRHITFLSQRPANKGPWHVFRTNVDSGEEKEISREPVAQSCRPCFAADGRVIFSIDRGRDGKLPLMDLVISDGDKETVLMKKNYIIASSTSPDGTQLAVIVPNELSIRNLKTNQTQTFSMKDVNPNWRLTYFGLLWRPDNQALALTFGFLGGLREGTRLDGDDHVGVLRLDGPRPTLTTYRVGTDHSLYAWVTDEDMKRKK